MGYEAIVKFPPPFPNDDIGGSMHTDFVITDYGNVRLSAKAIDWLQSIDKDWREIITSKKRRGKHAAYVRIQVKRLEDAVSIAASIAWNTGGCLEEF